MDTESWNRWPLISQVFGDDVNEHRLSVSCIKGKRLCPVDEKFWFRYNPNVKRSLLATFQVVLGFYMLSIVIWETATPCTAFALGYI